MQPKKLRTFQQDAPRIPIPIEESTEITLFIIIACANVFGVRAHNPFSTIHLEPYKPTNKISQISNPRLSILTQFSFTLADSTTIKCKINHRT